MKHRYNVWKPKDRSRTALIITNDGGNRYEKVAVFSNEESVGKFDAWINETIRESRESIESIERIRHGHWTSDCRCSICGEEAITEWNETGGAWVMTPYCPFCGAKMDEEENDASV